MSFPSTSNPVVTFRIGVQDRPGVMTAVANVFSGRGVSMESILTFRGWTLSDEPQVIVTVRASARRRRLLHRVLERLEVVNHVELIESDDASLFEMAWVRTGPGAEIGDGVRGLRLDQGSGGEGHFLLVGSCEAVEKELRRLDGAGQLLGANVSRMSS